jgi:hypothetical protein
MRCHRRVRWLATGGILALSLCGSLTAGAESYTYQGHTLKYAVPPGYCLMDRQGVIGGATYSLFQKAVGEDAEFVAIYLDCDELTAFVATHNSRILHGGAIAIPKSDGSIVVRDDETRRDEIDREVQKFSAIDISWVNEQLKRKAEERGIVFHELQDIRLIDHDNIAAYAAFLDARDELHQPMISVLALSLTNQLPFKNVMIAPAGDPNVVQTLLDSQHRYMSWLIAQNETAEQQLQQGQPSPGTFNGGGGLGSGSVLIGGVCLFGALWLLLRLLHSRA